MRTVAEIYLEVADLNSFECNEALINLLTCKHEIEINKLYFETNKKNVSLVILLIINQIVNMLVQKIIVIMITSVGIIIIIVIIVIRVMIKNIA